MVLFLQAPKQAGPLFLLAQVQEKFEDDHPVLRDMLFEIPDLLETGFPEVVSHIVDRFDTGQRHIVPPQIIVFEQTSTPYRL